MEGRKSLENLTAKMGGKVEREGKGGVTVASLLVIAKKEMAVAEGILDVFVAFVVVVVCSFVGVVVFVKVVALLKTAVVGLNDEIVVVEIADYATAAAAAFPGAVEHFGEHYPYSLPPSPCLNC